MPKRSDRNRRSLSAENASKSWLFSDDQSSFNSNVKTPPENDVIDLSCDDRFATVVKVPEKAPGMVPNGGKSGRDALIKKLDFGDSAADEAGYRANAEYNSPPSIINDTVTVPPSFRTPLTSNITIIAAAPGAAAAMMMNNSKPQWPGAGPSQVHRINSEPAASRKSSSFIVSDDAFISDDCDHDDSSIVSTEIYRQLNSAIVKKDVERTKRVGKQRFKPPAQTNHSDSDPDLTDSEGSDFDRGAIFDTTTNQDDNSSDAESTSGAGDVFIFDDLRTPQVKQRVKSDFDEKPSKKLDVPKVHRAKSEEVSKKPYPKPDIYDLDSDSENSPLVTPRFVKPGKRVREKTLKGRILSEINRTPSLSSPIVKRADVKETPKSSIGRTPITVKQAPRLGNEPSDFLKSLSPQCSNRNTDSQKFVGPSFKRNKTLLVSRLFQIYNETVFDNMLPSDLSIEWNKRLRKTAGLCKYRRSGTNRTARIELSEKVCDSADRVRDTLLHELCHAAVWLVNGDCKGGHGVLFKAWGDRAIRAFPRLPLVQTCHDYHIRAKFTYVCKGCGQRVQRHSKSLDLERKVCGICRGKFELHVNDLRADPASAADLKTAGNPGSGSVPKTPASRVPGPFALFVKEHYGSVKRENNVTSHKDVMSLLSVKFKSQVKLG